MSKSIRIGPYRLSKTLGVGTFSRVRLAYHEVTGEKVAIKILNRRKLRKMKMTAKARREIEILRRLKHPHIIKLFEVIDTPTDIFCVMEYVRGGEMFDYIISKGRVDETEARHIFQQLLCGVEACHVLRIVHRDLKPENILLDIDGTLKIADFGLSNLMKDGQFLRTSCGSPNYAAPEVIAGNPYAGPEVDVWSCGVILYAILCGSLPFDDENIRNLFRKIKEGRYHIPGYLSEDVRDLLSKLLEVEPMKRIRVAGIRKHKWFRQGLPKYLELTAEQHARIAEELDPEVVDKVVDLLSQSPSQAPCTREDVLDAIDRAFHESLLASPKMAQFIEARQMAVTYLLLLERKHRAHKKHVASSSVFWADAVASMADFNKPAVPAVSSSTVSRDRSLTGISDGHRKRRTRKRHQRRRWYLGLWSRLEPVLIIEELCRTLKTRGFEWKALSPFKLKARYLYTLSAQPQTPHVIKIGLQLYRSRNLYMLDIQKLQGALFPFLDLCASIVTELNISDERRARVKLAQVKVTSPALGAVSPRVMAAAPPSLDMPELDIG